MTAPTDLEVVKSAAPRTVLRGGGRVVKVYRDATWLDRLRRILLGRSPARREARNLRRAKEAGLPVPSVVEGEDDLAAAEPGDEALVIEEIPGARPLDEVVLEGSLTAAARHRLTRRLGALLRRVHDAGLDHPDLHAGNVLVDPAGEAWLIDLHRVTWRRGLRRHRGLLAFGRLFYLHGTRTDRLRFYLAFAPDARAEARVVERALQRSCDRFWRRRLAGRYTRSRHVRPVASERLVGTALTLFDGAGEIPIEPGAHEQVLKTGRTATVTSARLGGRAVILKRFHRKKALSPWIDLARGSRARRAFLAGHALLMRGIPTPEPLAWLERRDELRRPLESILVTERLSGRSGRAGLDDIEPARRRRRLEAIGRTVRRLREFGFAHRDLKLDNWHFPEGDDTPRLLDLDGLRRRAVDDATIGAHLARLDRDLVAIGAGRTDRLRVVAAALGPADRARIRLVLDAMEQRTDREARA